ncbi:hypothetical protein Tco_0233060 [Tanacetum coccineum]
MSKVPSRNNKERLLGGAWSDNALEDAGILKCDIRETPPPSKTSPLEDDDLVKEEAIEVDVNLPTPMTKPQSPINEPSQANTPTTHSNHISLQPHSLPLSDFCNTNVGQDSIPPQSINQSQTPFPHSLINPHVASVLHAQTPPSPQGDNHTQPPLSPSPSREMIMNDINQL